jgi:hypothetical protein
LSEAFGDIRTLPASKRAKKEMNHLVSKGLFGELRDVWRLGAAMGIASGQVVKETKRDTFQNVNSLDTDGVFAAIMVGLYPDMKPEERAKSLVNHAEWGIREIYRRSEIGTLNWKDIVAPKGK